MQRRSVKHAAKALKDRAADEQRHTADPDVLAEAQRMEARCKSYVRLHSSGPDAPTVGDDAGPVTSYAVEMYGLRKTFPRGGLVFGRQAPFIAVRGNWVGIHEGEYQQKAVCVLAMCIIISNIWCSCRRVLLSPGTKRSWQDNHDKLPDGGGSRDSWQVMDLRFVCM